MFTVENAVLGLLHHISVSVKLKFTMAITKAYLNEVEHLRLSFFGKIANRF